MTDTTLEALILDLLDWLRARDRSYEETLDAWRTSCPRLPVWEEANDRGLIARDEVNGRSIVRATPAGLALLEERRASKRLSRNGTTEPVATGSRPIPGPGKGRSGPVPPAAV
jgi:hypothetical protein